MKKLSELSLAELEKVEKTYLEIISQAGKLVIQDFGTFLVTIPQAIKKEIEEKKL